MTTTLSPKLLIVRESFFRDAMARSLIAQAHSEIAANLDTIFNGEPGCKATATAKACGGCRDCTYAQATWQDLTGDGLARWQVRAAELVTLLRAEMAAAQ